LDFRHVQFGIHEKGQLKRPADGHHVRFGENELAGALPVIAQLSAMAAFAKSPRE